MSKLFLLLGVLVICATAGMAFAKVFMKVRPGGHSAEVLPALASLQKAIAP